MKDEKILLVSVIIPTYNSDKFITKAINSILNQTYSNLEIIIVDDGSTDNTKDEIYNLKDNRIKYFYKSNGGESSARNFGLAQATGEFIAFLDADDLYHKEKIKRQVSILNSNPNIDIVYNDVILIDEENNKIGELKSEEIIEDSSNFLAQILFRQVIPASASIMLRRNCFKGNIIFPETYNYAEDYYFIIQLADKYNFYYLQESLYFYRRHSQNLTNNHIMQAGNEKEIVRSLGIEKITEIVSRTTYSDEEKTMLLSKILLKIGYFEDSLKQLNKIELIDWEYYFIKGVLYYYLKNYKEALNCFEASNKVQEKAESYNNLGCCLYKLNNLESAFNYFRKASTLNFLYNDPINNLKAIDNNSEVKITERKLRKQLTSYN